VFTFFGVYQSNNNANSGLHLAKNYNLSFTGMSDDNYRYQYSIEAYYSDSFDRESKCPAPLSGFRGKLNIEYQSGAKAKIEVLQNVKPYQKEEGSISAVACPAVAIPPASATLRLNKEWLESGNTNKTILINDKIYSLALNKQKRTIRFSGEGYERTQPYLPDGIAQLYAYPMYRNCMSTTQIQAYAEEHGIATADIKYPGLTAGIKAIPHLILEAPDGSQNVLLVMANDYVKELIEKTRNERGVQDTCRVVASKPIYVFMSP